MASEPASKAVKKEESTNNKSNKPDEQQLKTVSAVGYLGILFLVPLLMFPKEKFAVFHANQGLLLLIAAIAAQIVVTILVPFTLGLGALLYPVVAIGALILLIVGVLNAVNGKMQRLPLIGNFDILKVQE